VDIQRHKPTTTFAIIGRTLLTFLVTASLAFSAGWEAVQKLAPASKIEVKTGTAPDLRGTFVSADEATLVLRSKSGEQSVARVDVRRVRVADPSLRLRNGVIATAIGAGAGFGIGYAVCPQCANEGAGGKFTGPLTAIGAGAGAIGFLPSPYRTIYDVKR
jgi:hypothetical protein